MAIDSLGSPIRSTPLPIAERVQTTELKAPNETPEESRDSATPQSTEITSTALASDSSDPPPTASIPRGSILDLVV